MAPEWSLRPVCSFNWAAQLFLRGIPEIRRIRRISLLIGWGAAQFCSAAQLVLRGIPGRIRRIQRMSLSIGLGAAQLISAPQCEKLYPGISLRISWAMSRWDDAFIRLHSLARKSEESPAHQWSSQGMLLSICWAAQMGRPWAGFFTEKWSLRKV